MVIDGQTGTPHAVTAEELVERLDLSDYRCTGTCLLLDHDLQGDPGGFPGHLTIRDGRNFVQNFMQVI